MPQLKANDPIYNPTKHKGGYDKSIRRWRLDNGTIVKRTFFMAQRGVPDMNADDVWGFSIKKSETAAGFDDLVNNHNKVVNAALRLNDLITYDAGRSQKVQPIPSQILSAMRLSEWYLNSEGDVYQYIEAPIDVITSGELTIRCSDKGVEKELREVYERLDIWSILYESFMSCGYYGQAYPLVVYENPETDEYPNQITLMPPKYVYVGYYTNYGTGGGVYALKPIDDSEKWTQELVETAIMPMTYNAFSTNWNEQVNGGWGIPFNPKYLMPIRSKALQYNRYALPPIQRAFLPISERFVYREAVRAVVEGHRSQLWLYLLGDAEHPPTPQEMSALKTAVGASTGERTGSLAWRGNLKVEVLTPNGLDVLLGNDTKNNYTMDIFRALGSNIRTITGNSSMAGGRDGSSYEVDVSVWLTRINWIRKNVLRWEKWFRNQLAERNSKRAFRKYASEAEVDFADSPLAVADKIKAKLQPLYQFGALSTQTLLEESGYSYGTELGRKQDELPNKELFSPAPTFAQTTVNPNTPEKTAESSPKGRTPDVINPKQPKRVPKE